MPISLEPRTVYRYSPKRTVKEVTPTPFNQDRAKELKDLGSNDVTPYRGSVGWIEMAEGHMTDGEIAYVDAVWATLSGNSNWFSAFCEILNGRITA